MIITKDKVVFLHIPKTGGGAMQHFLYNQLKDQRNYFLSFFGHDDSLKHKDELSTNGNNQCLIESIWYNKKIVDKFENSPHFKMSKLLLGHTTYSFKELFPEYNFKFISVVREPIERTISNIVQLTKKGKNDLSFGKAKTNHKLYSKEYWDFIKDILVNGLPIPGLLRHENLFLSNIITRVFQGDKYLPETIEPNIEIAKQNMQNICIAFFDKYNESLQECFDNFNIPIDMSLNKRASGGSPTPSEAKKNNGKFYNAPDSIIDIIIDWNKIDIQLYKDIINL